MLTVNLRRRGPQPRNRPTTKSACSADPFSKLPSASLSGGVLASIGRADTSVVRWSFNLFAGLQPERKCFGQSVIMTLTTSGLLALSAVLPSSCQRRPVCQLRVIGARECFYELFLSVRKPELANAELRQASGTLRGMCTLAVSFR